MSLDCLVCLCDFFVSREGIYKSENMGVIRAREIVSNNQVDELKI
jgi:hypothetical protein